MAYALEWEIWSAENCFSIQLTRAYPTYALVVENELNGIFIVFNILGRNTQTLPVSDNALSLFRVFAVFSSDLLDATICARFNSADFQGFCYL